MCPQSTTTPDPESADLGPLSVPDLIQILERQIAAGFSPELAFDLVLHELVMRAAAATNASAAALALARNDEMVCRAATGLNAPDLGIPLNTREGLSGICLQTRQPQLCFDAESDPLVDDEAARRLGIRSMLIVPVIDGDAILGVLEVFSPEPAAFSAQHLTLLEGLANDCIRLQRALLQAQTRPPVVAQLPPRIPPAAPPEQPVTDPPPRFTSLAASPAPPRLYEGWTLVLGAVAILAAVALSFMIGSRMPAIRAALAQIRDQSPSAAIPAQPAAQPPPPVAPRAQNAAPPTGKTAAPRDELVIYDHGKVIFRMKPVPRSNNPVVAAAENTRLDGAIWLAPAQAERRLRSRIEPAYPPAALETHRSGEVVLELLVIEDGSIGSIRTVTGDPVLAAAAADAVRNWRYEPYRVNQRPTRFQTEVTLRFSLPDQSQP